MKKPTEAVVAAVVLLTAGPADRLAAQKVLEQFSYDSLRLSGIQLDFGLLGSNELRGAIVGGVRVDYGFIAPSVRVLLGLSYFAADFDREAQARFERRLESLIDDPTGDATVQLGRIRWSDIVADLDLQYVLPQGRSVWTYLGVGLGVHFRNGSGSAIEDTFVEDALDGIGAAANATLGLEVALGPAWRFALDGRGVVSPDLSSVSLRAGLMYRIGEARQGRQRRREGP